MFVSNFIHILFNHEDSKPADFTFLQRYREIRRVFLKRIKRHTTIVETQYDTLLIAYDVHIEIVGMGIVNDIHHKFFDRHIEHIPNITHRCHLFCLEDSFKDVGRPALNRLEMQSGHGLASIHVR